MHFIVVTAQRKTVLNNVLWLIHKEGDQNVKQMSLCQEGMFPFGMAFT